MDQNEFQSILSRMQPEGVDGAKIVVNGEVDFGYGGKMEIDLAPFLLELVRRINRLERSENYRVG